MANVKITALNSQSASLLADEDLFVVVDLSENETKRINLRTIKEVATDPISSNVANLQVGLAGTNTEMNTRFVAAYVEIATKDTIANVYQTYLTGTANDYAIYTHFEDNVVAIANSIALKSNLTNNSYELQLQADGNVSFPTGNIEAGNGYIGLAGSSVYLHDTSGNTYVRVTEDHVLLESNSTVWKFNGSDGILYFPSNNLIIDTGNEIYNYIDSYNSDYIRTLLDNNEKTIGWYLDGAAEGTRSTITFNSSNSRAIVADINGNLWTYNANASFTLPGGTVFDDKNYAGGASVLLAPANTTIELSAVNTGFRASNTTATIYTDAGNYTFDDNATLTLPGVGQPSQITFSESDGAYISQGMGQLVAHTGNGSSFVIETGNANAIWEFSSNGYLTLPSNSIIYETLSIADSITIIPGTGSNGSGNEGHGVDQSPIGQYADNITYPPGTAVRLNLVGATEDWADHNNSILYVVNNNGTNINLAVDAELNTTLNISTGTFSSGTLDLLKGADVNIETRSNVWSFTSTGRINLPNGPYILPGYPTSGAEYIPGMVTIVGEQVYLANTNGDSYVGASDYSAEMGTANTYVAATHTAVNIGVSPSFWSFNPDGTTIFPTVDVNLHNGGLQSGQVLKFGNSSIQAIITGPTPSEGASAQRLIIQGQRATGGGEGGDVYLWGGDADYNGGDIKIYAGDADNVSTGSGGYINIDAGSGYTQGGSLNLTAGDSTENGGSVNIIAGSAANGTHGAVNIYTTNGSWIFNSNGDLVLPDGGIITEGTTNIELIPIGGSNASQKVVIYPTVGEGNHIHITSGDQSVTDLYLGNDDQYFKVGANGNNTIGTGANTWTFDNIGLLTFPYSNLTIGYQSGGEYVATSQNTVLGVASQGPLGSTSLAWVENYSDYANSSISLIYANGPFAGYGSTQILVGNNATNVYNWSFNPDGTTIFPTLTVNLHNGGDQSAQVLKFGNSNLQAIITGPTPAANINAQRLIVQGQRGTGTGEGGDVYVWAGDSDVNGGDIKIYAGDADNVSTGVGGYINIDAGNGYNQGGDLTLTAGSSNEYGGTVYISAGSAANAYTGTNGYIRLSTSAGNWDFKADGNILLPPSGSIAPISGFMTLGQGLLVGADGSLLNANGNTWTLYGDLSNAASFITLPSNDDTTANVPLSITNYGSNVEITSNGTWIFGSDGSTTFPNNTIQTNDALSVRVPNGIPSAITAITGSSGMWESNPLTDLATTGGSGTGLTVNVSYEGGYASSIVIANAGSGYTNGDAITVTSGTSSATFTISVIGLNSWSFGTNGSLTLPTGGAITEGIATATNNTTVSTIELIPNGSNTSQKIVIYPTAAEGNHIHITSGDQSVTDLYLGNDDQYFRVNANGNNTISTGGNNIWNFDTDGTIYLPDNGSLKTSNGDLNIESITGFVNITSIGSTFTFDNHIGRFIMPAGGTITGAEGSNVVIEGPGGNVTFTSEGVVTIPGTIQGAEGANVIINTPVGNYIFASSGAFSLPGANVSLGAIPTGGEGISGSSNVSLTFLATGTSGSSAIEWYENTGDTANSTVAKVTANGYVQILTGNNTANANTYTWTFSPTGSIAFPNGDIQANAFTHAYVSNVTSGLTSANTNISNITQLPVSFQSDVTILGNLILRGNSTIIESNTINLGDTLLSLGANNVVNDLLDIGFYGHFWNSVANANSHAGLIRSAASKDWMIFSDYVIDLFGNSAVQLDDTANTKLTLGNLRISSVNAAVNITAANSIISPNIYSNGIELRSNDYATYLMVKGGLTGTNTLISSGSSAVLDVTTGLTGANTAIINLQSGLSGSNTRITNLTNGLLGSNTAILNLQGGQTGSNTDIVNLQTGLTGANALITTSSNSSVNLVTGLIGSNADIANLQVGLTGSNTAITNLTTGLTGSNTAIVNLTTGLSGSNTAIVDLISGLTATNSLISSGISTANLATGLNGANSAIANLQTGLSGSNATIVNIQTGLVGTNTLVAAITGNNVTFQKDVTIQGDLTVVGNSTSITSNTVVTGDTFLSLANNNRSSDVVDVGLYANYYDGSVLNHTGLFRSAVSKDWMLFRTYEDAITTNSTITLSATSFNLGNLRLATANVSKLIVGGTDIITAITANVTSLRSNDYATYQMAKGGLTGANTNIVSLQGGLLGSNSAISNLQTGLSGSNTYINNFITGLLGTNSLVGYSSNDIINLQTGLVGSNATILNVRTGLIGANTNIVNITTGQLGSNTKITNLQTGLIGSNTAITNLITGLEGANALINIDTVDAVALTGANTNITNLQTGLSGSNTAINNIRTGLVGANTLIYNITNLPVIFESDLSIRGNLFLTGNTVLLTPTVSSYGNSFISLADTNIAADILDIGIFGKYYSGTANSYSGLYRSAVSKDWLLFRDYTKANPSDDLDISDSSFKLANLRLATANVSSNLILNGTDIITTITDNVTSLRSNDYSTYLMARGGLAAANTLIINLQSGLVGSNTAISSLQGGMSGSNTAITNLITGLIGTNALVNTAIANLQVGLTGANTAITNLQSGLTGSNVTIALNSNAITNLQTGLSGSNTAITNLTAGLTGSNVSIVDLQTGLAGANDSISSISVDYTDVITGLTGSNTAITGLVTGLNGSNTAITGLVTGLGGSNTAIVNLTTGLTGANTNIVMLTGNIANIQVGLSGANTLINTVQNSLIAYANYANSTFGTASGNVNAVQDNLTAYALYANSTFSGGGGVNQGASYSWTNVHTFSNTIIINAVSANGSLGTAGQVLTSTGSDTYWAASTGTANITLTNATTQSFTADGTQNTFTLTTTIANQNNIIVTLNGLLQVPTTHYTISGTTLLFTDKPYANSLLEVRSLEGGIGLTGGPNNTGNVPQNAQSSSYTLSNTDTGKHVSITTGGVTVPNTTFATGDSVVIYNNSGSSQTITQGVNVTMRLVGTATTGNRTLAQYGLVTILCVAANTFVSMGGGLT